MALRAALWLGNWTRTHLLVLRLLAPMFASEFAIWPRELYHNLVACAKRSSAKRSCNSRSDLSLDQITPTIVMTMIVLLERPKMNKKMMMRFVSKSSIFSLLFD